MIRVALLGAGRMGLTHLRTLRALPDVRLVVVADANPDAAERGRAVGGAERATTDIAAAIRAPDVDAVIIVTPTDTHALLIEQAARTGKAIWCEKPIALTLAETERVVRTLEVTRVPFQIGFMRRFDPGYAAAKRKIDSGALGSIETFRALSRDTYLPKPEFLANSGGTFLDMAIHDFDLARFLVGEVWEVHAWGAVLVDEAFRAVGDVDTAITLLRFESGALGVVETARRSAWGYDIRTEVAGALGKVVVEAAQKTPMIFSRQFGFEGDHYESFPDRFEAAYRLQFEAFFDALRTGRPPQPSYEDALRTLRLALAARQSWREGRPVRVADASG
ncbi:MAG: inositol 2-dehydrogenase [Anaerolineae bacterium]|nr:inositol 2-dehydrogenase [Thermoflexales bacterium]MDW8396873.1 inositol 2-dehydrogenase [Anaerolineae bacterium]